MPVPQTNFLKSPNGYRSVAFHISGYENTLEDPEVWKSHSTGKDLTLLYQAREGPVSLGCSQSTTVRGFKLPPDTVCLHAGPKSPSWYQSLTCRSVATPATALLTKLLQDLYSSSSLQLTSDCHFVTELFTTTTWITCLHQSCVSCVSSLSLLTAFCLSASTR